MSKDRPIGSRMLVSSKIGQPHKSLTNRTNLHSSTVHCLRLAVPYSRAKWITRSLRQPDFGEDRQRRVWWYADIAPPGWIRLGRKQRQHDRKICRGLSL
jgi:hypothetical protein